MEFSCDCSVTIENDGPSVMRTTLRAARKQHVCGECGEPILPGQKYEYVTGCWDGLWGDHKTCYACYLIRSHYMPTGWYYGRVADDVSECLGFDYRDDPATYEDD